MVAKGRRNGRGTMNWSPRVAIAAGMVAACTALASPGHTMSGSAAQAAVGVAQRTPPSCFGRTATLVGTADDDVLRGTPDRDVIVGRGGRDIIRGFAGDDYICKGLHVRHDIAGEFYGGAGADHLRGRAYMRGQEGNDLMTSMLGTADGGSGDDQFIGGRRLHTTPGPGRDRVHFHGSGSLNYADASGPVTVNLTRGYALGEGRDTIRGARSLTSSGPSTPTCSAAAGAPIRSTARRDTTCSSAWPVRTFSSVPAAAMSLGAAPGTTRATALPTNGIAAPWIRTGTDGDSSVSVPRLPLYARFATGGPGCYRDRTSAGTLT